MQVFCFFSGMATNLGSGNWIAPNQKGVFPPGMTKLGLLKLVTLEWLEAWLFFSPQFSGMATKKRRLKFVANTYGKPHEQRPSAQHHSTVI